MIETTFAELRYAVRRLRAEPGFTAVAALTVAIGIGATTAIFSAVNPILFETLPYPDAGRIAVIQEIRSDGSHLDGTFGMYRGLSERVSSFDALAVFKPWQPTMTGRERPERLDGQRVSARYFQVLGVPPIIGRSFQSSDDLLNAANVVVLSDGLWRRRFEADPAIVGRQITLEGSGYDVIGVMPPDFENVLAPSAELWAPLQYDMSLGTAWGHHLRTVGRLRPGPGIEQAAREVRTAGRDVLQAYRPETYGPDVEFNVTPLQDEVTRGVKPALHAVLGGVILVLLIACVNVANLLVARGVRRRREFALRAALGAGQGRLARQLFIESLVLAAFGGAIGLAVAAAGVRALVAIAPPGLPRAGAMAVDATAFAFGIGLTTLVGLAFGLVPVLQALHGDPRPDFPDDLRHTPGGHRRIRGTLVVAEVALALVLLAGSGLLLRSLERLFAVPIGFDPSGLLTMQVQVSGQRFDADAEASRFFAQALEAVRRVPGVTEASFTSQLPLSGDLDEYGVHFEATPARPARSYGAFRYAVSPGYVETLRIALRRGRLLDDNDRAGAPPAALVSESLARLRFGEVDPIGHRLRIGPMDGSPYTIVGVVADVRQMSMASSMSDAVYTTAGQWRFADRTMWLVVRARGDAAAVVPAVREAVWSVDKDQPIVRVAMLDDLVAATAAGRRFALVLFEAFALAALALAAAGIFAVLAASVAERTREIGIRSALGATPGRILALVVREGFGLTGLGVAIGLAGAALASQALAALLFDVSPVDPVTYAVVVALLLVVSLVACAVPAWRATQIDPAVTLRAE
ncbi:MAG TPA: ABC transporter permease [Vicinamibacterales bacterium]|nr:ABC transporter permease [Vicinamibacterales bacterium]